MNKDVVDVEMKNFEPNEDSVEAKEPETVEESKDKRYTFHLGANTEDAVILNLDTTPLALPGAILVTPMSKSKLEASYMRHLDKVMGDNRNNEYMFLLEVHKLAKEKGKLSFVCNCKGRQFHAKAVSDYITKNWDNLEVALSYVDPDSQELTPMNKSGGMTIGDLPEDKRNMLLEAMERTRLEEERKARENEQVSKELEHS